MKKFLSLVLALTLTLSLCVIPAHAAVTEVKLNESSITLYVDKTQTLKADVTADNEADDKTVEWSSSDEDVATVNSQGRVRARAVGTATITATAGGKSDTCEVTVEPAPLNIKLGEVANGGYDRWDSDDLIEAIADAANARENDVDELYITSTSIGGTFYEDDDDGNKVRSTVNVLANSFGDLYFEATPGFLGDAEFDIAVKIKGVGYTGTLTVPVGPEDDDIDETVSAVEDDIYAVFNMPDSYYEVWYISSSKSSTYDKFFDGKKVTGWEGPFDYTDEIKVSLKSFDKDGTLTFNVVGLDDYGVASTGTLTVTLDLYNIEYSGAAGSDIYFAQKDFEAYLQDRAESAGIIGGRKSTASIDFDHVTFSIPSTTQGVLYNASSKIDRKTECTNLDRVNFVPAAKASGQIYIDFVVYGDYYASSTATKSTEKSYPGRVLVNVVREDIKYTVPVDGSVVFKAEDFQDFFDDTYKTGTLSYVKFTELPKVTDGALYATYSAIYAGTVAEESDKFYYDSKKVSDYDLDDVTFRTSLWSKAGTKVYIPFTAYGTKSYQSVDGWVVITVENARTMNFTDVKTSDWFYNNVKNAYSMGLIEGKTTTTFNPNDNMTYAEAVTLAARMNQLYYSGKVTLSNSTTGNWYSSYESYAISKGIISSALGNKANTKITRKDYVDIFYNALPASAYTVRNTVSSIPDLANNTANAKVYAFYRAGILTGYANTPGKTNGAFGPNDNIKRSEVATILIRMMDSGTRVYFTL